MQDFVRYGNDTKSTVYRSIGIDSEWSLVGRIFFVKLV